MVALKNVAEGLIRDIEVATTQLQHQMEPSVPEAQCKHTFATPMDVQVWRLGYNTFNEYIDVYI